MPLIKSRIIAFVALFAAVLGMSGCTTPTKPEEERPIEIGKTQFRGQIIPVYDARTVRSERSTPPVYPVEQRRAGIEGVGVVMIIVDETGKPLEFTIVSSSPSPEFGVAALAAAKTWHFFPLKDESGRPLLHALRMPVTFSISND
jgi:protein TonB